MAGCRHLRWNCREQHPSAVHSLRLPRAWGGQPCSFLQTNKEDHPQARANQNEVAADYNRVFVPDATCEDEVRAVGGSLSLKHYMSFSKMSHRADLWRYIKLYRQGGNYMDIKMALLCPLSTTMERVYALGDATAEGHRIAESLGGRSLKDVPHYNLMTSFEGRSYVPRKSRHGVYML